ncbi:hypothetical protein K435DRAFT_793598 [Dendrothele bispora CBS 962.96]|uniref:Uncharacterized protein n=1 Tax=Dendrothele bispora (strain CBS 962.96) TaxID=1314807 RepID=A0A4S8MEY5_DENBC|nr:hypothetical protein K435DRAFT_793598 [Dendrothele bispora CBS 962.96]
MSPEHMYSDIVAHNIPLVFNALLYGVYLVLFSFCIYIMRQRKSCVGKIQTIAIVALFMLATLGFIFGCIHTSLSIKRKFIDTKLKVRMVLWGLFDLAKKQIYRCYKVWGAKKKIIAFPVLISIINNGFALLELLSAGRIWWIGHQVAKVLPTGHINLTRRTIAVCLESGVMYPLALIPALVFICQKSHEFDVRLHQRSSSEENFINWTPGMHPGEDWGFVYIL